MNVSIPYHNLNAKQKKSIVSANQKPYKKVSKKFKSLMLNDLQSITGYSRKYIIYLLNLQNKTIMRRRNLVFKADITRTSTSKRGRRKIYTGDIAKILFKSFSPSMFTPTPVTNTIFFTFLSSFTSTSFASIYTTSQSESISRET